MLSLWPGLVLRPVNLVTYSLFIHYVNVSLAMILELVKGIGIQPFLVITDFYYISKWVHTTHAHTHTYTHKHTHTYTHTHINTHTHIQT